MRSTNFIYSKYIVLLFKWLSLSIFIWVCWRQKRQILRLCLVEHGEAKPTEFKFYKKTPWSTFLTWSWGVKDNQNLTFLCKFFRSLFILIILQRIFFSWKLGLILKIKPGSTKTILLAVLLHARQVKSFYWRLHSSSTIISPQVRIFFEK